MSYLNCTATLGLNYVVTEPLLLASQPLLATPTVSATYVIANGLVASPDSIDDHFEAVERTIAAGATHTYILSALTDTLPRNNPFAHVHTVIAKIKTRTAGDKLTLGPGALHGWTALIPSGTIPIYALFAWHVDKADSLPVVSGVTDQIDIINTGSNPIVYTFAIGGNTG